MSRGLLVDNGAIYSARHFARICGRLQTELKHTRPFKPQGRGKQEKFFRFVDQSFVPEAYDLIEQGKIKTLADLNRFFAAWLEVAYQQRVHNTFKQRPADRYFKDEHPIRRIAPHELAEIFLLEEKRRVDKTCSSPCSETSTRWSHAWRGRPSSSGSTPTRCPSSRYGKTEYAGRTPSC